MEVLPTVKATVARGSIKFRAAASDAPPELGYPRRCAMYFYRFIRSAQTFEMGALTLREAFDRACRDLDEDLAAPLEIREDDDIVYTLGDLCDLFDDWRAWKNGDGPHPVL
jgi:hypothetical protein